MYTFFTQDIEQLNMLYTRPQFSFVLLYGRNGTGKTSLVRDFCKDKKTIFFSARETAPVCLLSSFYHTVSACQKQVRLPAAFTGWEQAFSCIAELSSMHRLILVLDEFHLLAQHVPGFMDAFTHAVEHIFPAGRVFLLVTSSSISCIQQMLTDSSCKVFRFLTAKAYLNTIPFFACREVLSGFSPREQLLLYGITGGLPDYLRRIRPEQTAKENIAALFLGSDALKTSSPLPLLYQELREVSTYNFLLEIMAGGSTRLADIAEKASIGTNKCAKYLNTLMALGIIRKEFPAAGENQKKVRYAFADHMLYFWYCFIYPNLSAVLFGRGETVWERQILPQLNGYLLPVFETVCAEYLEKLAETGQTPFSYHHTGSWWTGGTKREPYFRIPLVAVDKSHAVLGICHFADEPADTEYLDKLLQPLEDLEGLTRYCCIFSASGFTKELTQRANGTKNVWLAELEDIVSL